MEPAFDLLIANATVVNHDGTGLRDIGIRRGRIAAVGRLPHARSAETVDCGGLHVLPGVIDTQVHLREPGAEHKEDLETGGRAAVLGGVTGVFEMPNTDPLTVSDAALADKVARASNRMFCDFAFYVGGTRDNARDLARLERLAGCCGVKVFMGSSTGNLLVPDDAAIAAILAGIHRRAAFHAEDEPRLLSRRGERRPGDPASHPVWRDAEAARLATERLLRLARVAGKRIHVLHVSTAEELPLLAANRDIASVEMTANHLTLHGPEAYERLGTRAQMNPPLRDARNRDALWAAVRSGLVDVLGSDHAPHTLEEKSRAYPDSPSGMPGVQTLVPVMLDHVDKGMLTLERFVDLTSHGPARLFQIARKGRIAEGYDADLTIVDLKRESIITNGWIASRCAWTPFDGVKVTGWPVSTVVRGRVVVRDGAIVGSAAGRPMEFLETLAPARERDFKMEKSA
jgi:dihydroorotase